MAKLDLKAKIEELLAAGKSYQEIGDELGISKGQAWKIVHGAKEQKKSDKEEKEQKQKERDKFVLLERATEILIKVRDWYLRNVCFLIDVPRVLHFYNDYLKRKPDIMIKLWVGIEEIFVMDFYLFLRRHARDFLSETLEGNMYMLLSACFDSVIGGCFFSKMLQHDDGIFRSEREKKIERKRLKRKRKRKREKIIIKHGKTNLIKAGDKYE